MSINAIMLFLHVVGALGVFAAIGLEWAVLRGLRRAATIEQTRLWMQMMRSIGRLAGPSALILLITGLHLSAAVWGFRAWVVVGLIGFVVLAAMGPIINVPRIGAAARGLPDGDGPVPAELLGRLRDPVLLLSAWIRTALGLGVVFLMTAKPGLSTSVGAIVVSLAIGTLAGIAASRRQREPDDRLPEANPDRA